MPPRRVMIIRHGEKPPEAGGGPLGIDENGKAEEDDLTVQGWQRSGALVPFFAPRDGRLASAALAVPTAIFATQPTDATPSRRPKHTVKPLAAALGIARDLRFSQGQEAELATAILAEEGVVLVCWEHRNIAIVVDQITRGAVRSPHWRGSRFDIVLVLDPAGQGWTLTQVPQLLLAGDSAEPLPDRKGDTP